MNRRTFLTQCTVATAGLTTLWQGCQSADTGSALASDTQGQGAATQPRAASLAQPAIDLTAPAAFETATFAMG